MADSCGKEERKPKPLSDPGGVQHCEGLFVNTGSPHVVFRVPHIEYHDVVGIGKRIRQDPLLRPEGANVNFVQYIDKNRLALRTYERGVETETLACGTGSVASGIISHLYRGQHFPTSVQVESGETLKISATIEGNQIRAPKLEGSAHILFTGRLLYDADGQSIVESVRAGA